MSCVSVSSSFTDGKIVKLSNFYKIQFIILQGLIQGRFHSGSRHWAARFKCPNSKKKIKRQKKKK